jgi:hypothetical protein
MNVGDEPRPVAGPEPLPKDISASILNCVTPMTGRTLRTRQRERLSTAPKKSAKSPAKRMARIAYRTGFKKVPGTYSGGDKYHYGIDLHARSLYLCILDQEGTVLVHRKLPCDRELLLKTLAPYREDLGWPSLLFPRQV